MSYVLAHRLSNLLEGKSFESWCEDTIDDLTPNVIPINLEHYFPKRKIEEILINTTLSFPARLIKTDYCFKIEINKDFDWANNKEYRFIVAHEIAHTFQFTFKNGLILDKAFFLSGSKEAEYFSNRIARSILVPRKIVYSLIKKIPKIDHFYFSLKEFQNLSRLFNVQYSHFLQRLINDLEIVQHVAIFHFIKQNENNLWHLSGRFLSNEYNTDKKYFVPYANKDKASTDLTRLPSCDKKLCMYLDELMEDKTILDESRILAPKNKVNHKPLTTFFKNFEQDFFQNVYILKQQSPYGASINMMFCLTSQQPIALTLAF